MSYVNRNVAESVVEAVSLVLPEAKLFVIEGTEVHKAAVEKVQHKFYSYTVKNAFGAFYSIRNLYKKFR
ncbi:hypothetical protein BABA_23470 [Neobacillus bataviensis LMG 21833]|uniref:Uncharacterized protein n=1 Tax=Neobacillus bataviensis LMG 21833 TaxID=1117379 RepID=K6DTY6_9BACI|nr:hypothetical protein BABA_23470 [Neobacillus bataviensis LMG 21833]